MEHYVRVPRTSCLSIRPTPYALRLLFPTSLLRLPAAIQAPCEEFLLLRQRCEKLTSDRDVPNISLVGTVLIYMLKARCSLGVMNQLSRRRIRMTFGEGIMMNQSSLESKVSETCLDHAHEVLASLNSILGANTECLAASELAIPGFDIDLEPPAFDHLPPTGNPVSLINSYMGDTMSGCMKEVSTFCHGIFNIENLNSSIGGSSLMTPSTANARASVVHASDFEQGHRSPSIPHEVAQSPQYHTTGDPKAGSNMRTVPETSAQPSQGSLPRRRSRYFRADHHQGSAPIAVPRFPINDDQALSPMQRWQDSPPEVEAASLAAIADALKNTLPSLGSSSGSSRNRYKANRRQAAYSTSGGTSISSISTGSSRSTTPNRGHRTRSRRTYVAKSAASRGRHGLSGANEERRLFQCTFCCDSFRTKYDWARHETSLHLSLEKWVCSPHGGAVISQATGRRHCAYCNMLDPTSEHLEAHGHSVCHSSGGTHEFSRKDHLVQHLRLVHRLNTLPIINDWKVEAAPMMSRCGFCNMKMHTWKQRADHLSTHFNEGKTMDDWQGGHGFEPAIEAQVMNALPPYTLGTERKSFVPFSATSSVSRDQVMQMQKFYEDRQSGEEDIYQPPSLESFATHQLPTQTEVAIESPLVSHTSMTWITRGMAQFARRQMRLGILPTDAMFQDEARRLIYGSEDGWEQTIADNEEWLANFRAEIIENNYSQTLESPSSG